MTANDVLEIYIATSGTASPNNDPFCYSTTPSQYSKQIIIPLNQHYLYDFSQIPLAAVITSFFRYMCDTARQQAPISELPLVQIPSCVTQQ